MAERDCAPASTGSSEAVALRHLSLAESGARMPLNLASAAAAPLERCAVIGGGTMGAGIAFALLRTGLSVSLVETDKDGIARARTNLGKLTEGALARGRLDQRGAAELGERLVCHVGYGLLGDADLVVEAAFESMEVKQAIFEAVDRAAPHAVLATNTSYLDINDIAKATSRPDAVLGLHFFSPAHVMKLLEIVRADATSDATLATGFALAERLKKLPVLAGVCDGFIGNRILARYREIADMVLLDGGLPWEIDEAMVDFGYPMGPYAAQDLSGLDIAYANRKRLARTRDPLRRYVSISDRMVQEGRLGKKVGVGWYRYPGGGGAVIDPLLEDLIAEESYFAKVTRRPFTHDEIRRRVLAAMINEAAQVLFEGFAASAADIDLVTVHGYGFPRRRGGLMHFATEYGLRNVVADIAELAKEDAIVWRPTPGLLALAEAEVGKRRGTT